MKLAQEFENIFSPAIKEVQKIMYIIVALLNGTQYHIPWA